MSEKQTSEHPNHEPEHLGKKIKHAEVNLVHMLNPAREETLPDEVPSPLGETHEVTLEKSKNAFLKLMEPPKDRILRKRWFRNRILLLAIAVFAAVIAVLLGADKPIVGALLVVFGFASSLFTGAIALFGLIPVVGPVIVWALSLPFIWLMNGLGYVFSIKLAAEGKGRDLLNWRTVTIVFITGIVIGIVIGRLLPSGK